MYDNGYHYGKEGEWLGELLAVPLDPRFQEPVSRSGRSPHHLISQYLIKAFDTAGHGAALRQSV